MQAKLTTLLVIAALSGGAANAAVLFSTTFTASSATTDTIAFNGSTSSVGQHGVTGAGSNAASSWITVPDAGKVDVATTLQVSDGTNTWGASTANNNHIFKGEFFVTSTTFGILNGGSQAVRIPGTVNTAANALQFNNSANHSGFINLIFEIKTGSEYKNFALDFTAGTSSTARVWDNNTAAQNGNYNVGIFSLSNTGTIGSGFSFYSSAQAIGAGAGVAVNAVQQGTQTLNAGYYLLQIALTDKTQTQRYTIDDVTFSGTLVPEPSAALLGGLGMLALLRRRRA